jgi:hypothetical protein
MWPHCYSHLSSNGISKFWISISSIETTFKIPSLSLWSHLQRAVKTNCSSHNQIWWQPLIPWHKVCRCILCPTSQYNSCTYLWINIHVSFLQLRCNQFTGWWCEVMCSWQQQMEVKMQQVQCMLISQGVAQYMIFSVMINRFLQTSIKVINLQAVSFTQGLPLSQFDILFLGNNCRLTSHFAANRVTKIKVHKMVACLVST